MKSTTPSGPLSVPISAALRRRLLAQARKRNLKLATTARALLDERLTDLEREAPLTATEEWQRAQAWASWDKLQEEGLVLERADSLAHEAQVALASVKRRR